MEIPEHLLAGSLPCACGQTHTVPIEKIVVGHEAQQELVAYLQQRNLHNVLLVADANTYAACGESLAAKLVGAQWHVQTRLFSGEEELLPDEAAVLHVRQALQQHTYDIVLAVGSGVINDIVRYATHAEGLGYISVPTAASVDGYASSIAAMQFDGLKITTPAQAPQAIFADLAVLRETPFHLIQSGFGDLAGKAISLLDWQLARTLYGEYFCPTSYEIVFQPLAYVVEHAEQIKARDEEAVKNLCIGLMNSGIAMAMMGNSRPCSGSEHHCSHFWDLSAYHHERHHHAHGLQVGYATHWMIRFYQFVWQLEHIAPPLVPEVTDAFVEEARKRYGAGADEIISVQQAKHDAQQTQQSAIAAVSMQAVRAALQPGFALLDDVKQALFKMDIPDTAGFIEIDKELLGKTFLHAKALRSRYTVFDFLAGQDLLNKAADEILSGDM
ncbi:sn-glycerol-1-phosphate dehydrogenase [Alicyclobacillus fodiniaquatilis]|uniref:Sn-glycerol-1-phosphate dehydrogenase n=1 Tax=Alicyclobacillus fodiniaquatilis TaxID=1661150 RepID=A0ABW4JDT5_9BACL